VKNAPNRTGHAPAQKLQTRKPGGRFWPAEQAEQDCHWGHPETEAGSTGL